METKVEVLEDGSAKVVVTVDAKDIDTRIKKTYKDFAHKYNFPGFRKGKAPRQIIDNALGKEAVTATVTDEVVNASYPLAIDTCELYPISKPEFEEDMDLVEAGKPYTFEFTVALKPTFELASYEPVEIELPAEGVTDQEIEDQLNGLREHYQALEDSSAATKVKKDSFIDIAIKALDEKGEEIADLAAESRPYGMGEGLFPAAFDENLIGLKKGQSATFALEITEDAPFLLAAIKDRTKSVDFEVTINVVKKKVLPELTDEFAQGIGFDDVEKLREGVSDSIAQQKADFMPRMKESACLNAIAERFEGEVPEAMINDAEAGLVQEFFKQLQSQGVTFDMYLAQQGITTDQFKADVKAQAADTTKQDLALDAWARHFEITASEQDIKDEFTHSGAQDPEALYEEWRVSGQLHMVRQGILRTKSVLNLMDTAVVTELEPAKKEAKKKTKKAEKKEEASEVEAVKDAE